MQTVFKSGGSGIATVSNTDFQPKSTRNTFHKSLKSEWSLVFVPYQCMFHSSPFFPLSGDDSVALRV